MIEYYLSSNNEMCYNTKTNNFSPTKQGLSQKYFLQENIKVEYFLSVL